MQQTPPLRVPIGKPPCMTRPQSKHNDRPAGTRLSPTTETTSHDHTKNWYKIPDVSYLYKKINASENCVRSRAFGHAHEHAWLSKRRKSPERPTNAIITQYCNTSVAYLYGKRVGKHAHKSGKKKLATIPDERRENKKKNGPPRRTTYHQVSINAKYSSEDSTQHYTTLPASQQTNQNIK